MARHARHRIDRRLPLLAWGLVCLASCQYISPSVWVEEDRSVELSAEGVEHLHLVGDDGLIEVTGAEAEQILVSARLRAGGADADDARACMAALRLDSVTRDGRHHVEPKLTDTSRQGWGVDVVYTVTVPHRLALTVRADDGNVTVRGVRGALDIDADDGNVEVTGGQGDLRVRTDDGRVDAHTAAARIDLGSDDGDVTATLTHSGPIGGSVDNDDGAVSLEFTADAATELIVRTDDGRIDCALTLQDLRIDEGSLRGTLRGGGATLEIETDDGDVTLR